MENITKTMIQSVVVPKAALIAYGNDHDNYYVELRPIKNGRMGAAIPITKKKLTSVFSDLMRSKDLQATRKPFGTIPERAIYVDTNTDTYIWWAPAQKHRQMFVESIGLKDGEFPYPAMIYMLQGETLSAFAIKESEPKGTTQLYKAPLFNYYDNQRICLGTSKVTVPLRMSWEEFFGAWENLLWNSVNSHLICNPVKGNLTVILESLRGRDKFDTKVLVNTRKRLRDIIPGATTRTKKQQ